MVGEWKREGPLVAVEFSRTSNHRRLSSVVDEKDTVDVNTRVAVSGAARLDLALTQKIWLQIWRRPDILVLKGGRQCEAQKDFGGFQKIYWHLLYAYKPLRGQPANKPMS
jgi:hypothetical protein